MLDRPQRVTAVPRETKAILLTVRFDQLALSDAPLPHLLREAPAVPILAITPMLPGPRALVEKSWAGGSRRRCPAPPATSTSAAWSATG